MKNPRRARRPAQPIPGPFATSVAYDDGTDEIRIVLETGVVLTVSRHLVEELRDLPRSHMRDLSLIGEGEALASEADDVHIFFPGLLWDIVGFNAPVSCWSGETPAPKPVRRKGQTPRHPAA